MGAGVLAALATLTRATGILLVAALAVTAWEDYRAGNGRRAALGAIALPLAAWGLHMALLARAGLSMAAAQQGYGRTLLAPGNVQIVLNDLGYMLTHRMGAVHIALDIALPLLAGWECWSARREWPALALYGALALLVPFASGQLVSMNRYALMALPVYLVLARKGRDPLFDRLWTLTAVLLLALYLVGFAHGYWTG